MIDREISKLITQQVHRVVLVQGARRAGKKHIATSLFPDRSIVSLDAIDNEDFALNDPEGFLDQFGTAGVIVAAHRVPGLVNLACQRAENNDSDHRYMFVTNKRLVTHTDRSAERDPLTVWTLMPFSMVELDTGGDSRSTSEWILQGGFPEVISQTAPPASFFDDYVETLFTSDIGSEIRRQHRADFRRLLWLLVSRIGEPVNYTAWSRELGVSAVTVRQWIDRLTDWFVVYLTPAYDGLIPRKRLVKAPLLFFCDTGLACHLLGIETLAHLASHPLENALFKNYLMNEIQKCWFNNGWQVKQSYLRDHHGLMCDWIGEVFGRTVAVDFRRSTTGSSRLFRDNRKVVSTLPGDVNSLVVYEGADTQYRDDAKLRPSRALVAELRAWYAEAQLAQQFNERGSGNPAEVELDRIYHEEIRPVLDVLQDVVAPQLAEKFETSNAVSYVFGANSPTLLERDRWERTKQRYVLTDGFEFRDDDTLPIQAIYSFSRYRERPPKHVNLVISISWRLGLSGFYRELSVDGVVIDSESGFHSYGNTRRQERRTLNVAVSTVRVAMEVINDKTR